MQELEKILEEIEAEHPYKVPGNYESYSQYNEAWQDAIDRVRVKLEKFFKEKENAGWIPVEERLPGIGRKVLVSFRYTGWQPVIAFLSEEDRWLMLQGMKGYNDVTHDVSAWMPLPKPYHPKSVDWKENLLKKFDKRT